jgi:uncharacterized protein
MDRVLASEARGCWFDPSRAHQSPQRDSPPRRAALKILQIKVKPNARVNALVVQDDGSWLAQIAAPAVDGQANAALIALVARHCGVRRAQVRIKTGGSARIKLVQVDD